MAHSGMPSRSRWGLTPRQSIELECARRGESSVVVCCVDLLAGRDVDDALVFGIGGPAARAVLDGRQQYWLRVWAMRALLYAWADAARPAVVNGLTGEAWRVREMAARVIARRQLGDALPMTIPGPPVLLAGAATGRPGRYLRRAGRSGLSTPRLGLRGGARPSWPSSPRTGQQSAAG